MLGSVPNPATTCLIETLTIALASDKCVTLKCVTLKCVTLARAHQPLVARIGDLGHLA
jgi:hypothetical protein